MNEQHERAARAFAAIARRYLAFIDEHVTVPADARPRVALAHLLELLRAAHDLPSVSPSHARTPPDVHSPPPVDVSEFDYYWETLEPFRSSEIGVGSLADDLADIYVDLASGLALHDRGELRDAVWTWKFHFQAHWGDHAVDAIRALHRVVTGHGAMLGQA